MSINLPPVPYQDLKDMPISYQIWYNQMRQYALGTLSPGLNNFQPTYSTKFFEDFICGDAVNVSTNNSILNTNFIRKCTTAGCAVTFVNPVLNEPGTVSLQTGNSASTVGITTDNTGHWGSIILNAGACFLEWRVYIPVLSNASNEYILTVGLNALSGTDCVAFVYNRATNGVNWQAVVKSIGHGTTTVDTGVVVNASTWYKLTWISSADGTKINYYINGTYVTTISDGNVPSQIQRVLPINMIMQNTAGTSNQVSYADYCAFQQVFNTANFR